MSSYFGSEIALADKRTQHYRPGAGDTVGVKNAQLTYEINVERYQNGDLTGMDLNLFQTQLSEQKMTLTTALIDYKLELLNMKIQSLWDFETDMSYFPEEIINKSTLE